MSDIMTAQRWPTNAHLIADVARLGFIRRGMEAIDVTHGRGVWWKQWRPDSLVRVSHGDPGAAAHDLQADFRTLPFPAASFDLVAFDPPYMPVGSPGKLAGMHERFGLQTVSRSDRQQEILDLMRDGLTEAARICRPGGTILSKAGRGIDGGRLFRGDHHLVVHGESLGLEVVTQFFMLTTPRPQAHRGPQKTPRSNMSTLTVWRRLWFSDDEADRAEAVRICHTCPVIDRCAEFGAAETIGVWGGIDKTKRRGRPRKDQP